MTLSKLCRDCRRPRPANARMGHFHCPLSAGLSRIPDDGGSWSGPSGPTENPGVGGSTTNAISAATKNTSSIQAMLWHARRCAKSQPAKWPAALQRKSHRRSDFRQLREKFLQQPRRTRRRGPLDGPRRREYVSGHLDFTAPVLTLEERTDVERDHQSSGCGDPALPLRPWRLRLA